MKLLMSITSAPTGRNRPMSISHRRDKPFIMAVIARYRRERIEIKCLLKCIQEVQVWKPDFMNIFFFYQYISFVQCFSHTTKKLS